MFLDRKVLVTEGQDLYVQLCFEDLHIESWPMKQLVSFLSGMHSEIFKEVSSLE